MSTRSSLNQCGHWVPAGLAVSVVLMLNACDASRAGRAEALDLRDGDGLMHDVGLQGIVDLQVDRNGTTLAVMLSDERADVRARAALALGSVQDPDALDALVVTLMEDPDPGVRRDAAFAIGQLGLDAAVPALRDALGSESDDDVVDRVLEALGKIPADEATQVLLGADIATGHEARRALALSVNGAVHQIQSRDALDFLLAHLDHSDGDVRRGAAYYFGRTNATQNWSPRAVRVREVLDGLGSGDPAAMYLVQALGKLQAPDDAGRLLAWATGDAEWRTRVEALTGLGGRPLTDESRAALIATLDAPVEHVAFGAAVVLAAEMQPPSVLARLKTWVEVNPQRHIVVEPLLAVLARQNEREVVFDWVDALSADDTRGWAIGLNALGFLSGTEALDRLGRAVASPAEEVTAAAILALSDRWVSDQRNPALAATYFDLFSNAVLAGNPNAEFTAGQRLVEGAFSDMGAPDVIVAAYESRLAGGDPRRAAQMLRLVAMVQAPEAEGLLRDALDHPAAVIRSIAASGLETLTGEVVVVDTESDGEEIRRGSVDLPYDPTVIDWEYLGELGNAPELRFETDRGAFVVRLVPEEAPHTVQTMARLAEEGGFGGSPFHRVIANFVVQGGDVDGGTGRGGPGFQITSEFNTLPYQRGSIGMASAGKDTEGSQFFLAHSRLPHLDGGYTVFGWVVEGMDVVDAITRGDRIMSVSLQRD
ncbi:MAG: hypothetical protein HN396_15590 [Gemmatimonadales bacterium]|nr:hypothetical protein [Gemmatimonadales bacterium]MBT3775296.1 hypothetical protein [Gemmatimonadales bacterium]MBT3957414.1 hypothetical protein [Gemmatimonadales bacterium]MBT4436509.1 hypothetical protein [Gemmatimonadales bacterium]MBT4915120.1 hypothetical protein [Gemmatimonadales bacterium]